VGGAGFFVFERRKRAQRGWVPKKASPFVVGGEGFLWGGRRGLGGGGGVGRAGVVGGKSFLLGGGRG